jgi:hypothetical protein
MEKQKDAAHVGDMVMVVLETGVGQRHYQHTTLLKQISPTWFYLAEPLSRPSPFTQIRWFKGKWRPVGISSNEFRFYHLYFGADALHYKNTIDVDDNHPW